MLIMLVSRKSAHGGNILQACTRGVHILLNVSAFNYKRVPCMLTATHRSIVRIITFNRVASFGSSSQDSMQHSEQQMATVSTAPLSDYDAECNTKFSCLRHQRKVLIEDINFLVTCPKHPDASLDSE